MLEIHIPKTELFDEEKNQFVEIHPTVLRLEHSLVSISKWESKWKIPFLVNQPEKTREQSLDYIRFMTINQNVPENVYLALTPQHLKEINEYMSESRTATTFSKPSGPPNRQVLTSELIYFFIAQYNLPIEAQKWHISRLLTLIRIASIKNSAETRKMSRSEILSRNAQLNAARRSKFNTKG